MCRRPSTKVRSVVWQNSNLDDLPRIAICTYSLHRDGITQVIDNIGVGNVISPIG